MTKVCPGKLRAQTVPPVLLRNCHCAIDLEMVVFTRNGAFLVHLPFSRPEMVKFCRNLCSCAVDLEMAVFNWKRAVSSSSAL